MKCLNKHFLEKGEKIPQQNRLLAIKWKHIRDVSFLTIAHEDVLVEAPLPIGAPVAYRGGWFGGFKHNPPPPTRNSEVLTKLSRIPSSVEHIFLTV
jgi:hypothetical protein